MNAGRRIEEILRIATPQVLGALARRYGDFEACEDAVQEALFAAAQAWPLEGIPANPVGWLITAAARRRIDELRANVARMRREATDAALSLRDMEREWADPVPDPDDTLALLVLCCHPSLTPASQVALALRAVAGLNTSQIAAAFLVAPGTIAKRITRAKRAIKASGAEFELPSGAELAVALQTIQHVIYLIFNEGYATSSGYQLASPDLAAEAIRLARLLHQRLPADGEATGLLALLLLINARGDARATTEGRLVPLAEQERSLWDKAAIQEGVDLISDSLSRRALGPYQVQAAIAALHAEAESAEATDWPQILALYEVLDCISPSPMASLSQAVAAAMVHGPDAGLGRLAVLGAAEPLASHHRLRAVRAHLLRLAGDDDAAQAEFRIAAKAASNEAERRYLAGKASGLGAPSARNAGIASPPLPDRWPEATRD